MKTSSRDINKMKAPRCLMCNRGLEAPTEQNMTGQYIVFGSVEALDGFGATCSVVFDEVEIEKIDHDGGHFRVLVCQADGFRALAAQYGLQVSGGRV